MAEKLVITLTDRDIDVVPKSDDEWDVQYLSKCILCSHPLVLTRIKGDRCECGISWGVDVKIKGVRTYTDEDRDQPTLPFTTTA